MFNSAIRNFTSNPLILLGLFTMFILLVWALYHYLWSKRIDRKRIKIIKRVRVIFSIPLTNKMKNLKVISQYSDDYKKGYELFSKQFEEITDRDFKLLKEEIEDVNILRKRRKYKRVNELLNKMLPGLEGIEIKVNKLNNDLDKTREVEQLQRKEHIKLKQKWSEIKSLYNHKRIVLKDYSENLEEIIKEINTKFSLIEEYVNTGKYDESREVIFKLEDQLVEFAKAVEFMPDIIARCSRVIPNRLKKYEEEIHEASKQGIKFSTFQLKERMEFMKDTIREIFVTLNTKDINKAIDLANGVQKEDIRIRELIKAEKKAFTAFKENYTSAIKEFEDVITTFAEVEPQVRREVNAGKLTDEELAIVKNLKAKIKRLHDVVKKFTNEINNHRDDYSYSDHVKGLLFVIKKIEKTRLELKKVYIILEELTVMAHKFSESQRELNLALAQIETRILESKYKINEENFMIQVNDCKTRIDEAKSALESKGFSIEEALEQVMAVTPKVANILEALNKVTKTAELAEKTFVMASRYKSMSVTIERQWATADVEYKKGNYSKCLELSMNILEKADANITFREVVTSNE